jgi:hypothetical protein
MQRASPYQKGVFLFSPKLYFSFRLLSVPGKRGGKNICREEGSRKKIAAKLSADTQTHAKKKIAADKKTEKNRE